MNTCLTDVFDYRAIAIAQRRSPRMKLRVNQAYCLGEHVDRRGLLVQGVV